MSIGNPLVELKGWIAAGCFFGGIMLMFSASEYGGGGMLVVGVLLAIVGAAIFLSQLRSIWLRQRK